ncbi:TetR/AcrR family transcriptional regulator [Shewanella donghaensis]|uniref:TetR/AcrR family transcriptional regulator n=1 Tax=Shewanella donghaensis TaxID=238836 RepID=UPI0011840C27|nr:TetR-like C-terminal domain-containing protein [Shewanella donghaensis]
MARRKEHTHAQLHDMAINTVMAYLQTSTLASLSLRKVATTIGYAPSTLINIFGSYQQLLLSVSETVLEDLYSLLETALETELRSSTSPTDPLHEQTDCYKDQPLQGATKAIEVLAQQYSQFALSNPACFKLVFELSTPEDMALSSSHQATIDKLFQLVALELSRLFPRAIEQDIELMSRVLWGGIHGLTCLSLDGKLFSDTTQLPKMLTSHIQGYLSGMAKNKDVSCC